jgi:hypothetical protein
LALGNNLQWVESKILEGDTRALKLALSLAASHAIQPAHVNAAATPQGSHKHDSVEGVAHPFDIVPFTDIEVSCSALLGEPDIDIVHQSVRTLVKKLNKNFTQACSFWEMEYNIINKEYLEHNIFKVI